VDFFLEHLEKAFEIIVFTASREEYAQHVCEILDPEGKYI
jgi:TFIIF-interacting CTD phosphatase-like protein